MAASFRTITRVGRRMSSASALRHSSRPHLRFLLRPSHSSGTNGDAGEDEELHPTWRWDSPVLTTQCMFFTLAVLLLLLLLVIDAKRLRDSGSLSRNITPPRQWHGNDKMVVQFKRGETGGYLSSLEHGSYGKLACTARTWLVGTALYGFYESPYVTTSY